MARVLLQHRLRGLSGPLFQKFGNKLVHTVGNYLAGAGGLPDLPWPENTTFIGAFRGETDVQNVNVDGEICNLMPLGTISATSIHNAPILAPDFDGVYREYGVDEPVWKGARWDAGVSYSTDTDGNPLKPTPFLQANEATTNLELYSDDYANGKWIKQQIVIDSLNVKEDTSTNTHRLVVSVANSPMNAGEYTLSAIVKSSNRHISLSAGGNIGSATFNLSNGTVSQTKGSALIAHGIFSMGGDTYQVYITTSDTANRQEVISLIKDPNAVLDSFSSESYLGDGVSFVEVMNIQVTAGANPGIPVISGATAESIPATEYTFPAANIDPVEDTRIIFRFENTGADGPILDIGKNLELGMLSNELILTDGINTVSLPVTKGTHDINIIVSGHEMAIKAGDAYAVGAYTSVPAGVITVNRNIWALHTIPAVDLERVLNGDFEDGDTGWTGVSVTNGQATTVSTTGYQVIHTTAGIEYSLNFTCDAKGVSPQLQIQNGNVTGSPVIAEVNPSGNGAMVPYSATFTALGPDSIVILSNGSNTALWDNISIKAV